MANKTRKKKKNKLLIFGLEILLLVILLVVVYVWSIVGKIHMESMSEEEAGVNSDLDADTLAVLEGYTNIALFGLDNRGSDNYASGNSDSIMIVSINNDTKEVKIVSVFRDTYLSIGNGKYRKANAAYAVGGATQAVQMLNSNLDLNISAYVSIDWKALVEAIDALGGIDIELTSAELEPMNMYIPEIDAMTGYSTSPVTSAGLTHLNGTQATAYTRVRYTAGDDFKRASRQRIVLQAMLDEAKQADVGTLIEICNEVFDDIYTSLDLKDIIALAKDVKSYEIVSTTGFPFALTTADLSGAGDSVVAAELSNNVSDLHTYMFGVENYVPSTTVQQISDTIVTQSGVAKDSATVDISAYNNTVGQNGTDFKSQEEQ